MTAERIIDAATRETYGKGWHDEWVVHSACAECLSVTEIVLGGADEPKATVLFRGTEVTRLRDQLRRAHEDGSLRRVIGKLLTDPVRCVMVGVPEIFPDALPGIGKHLRLRTNLEMLALPDSRPAWLGPPIPQTEPWGGPISRRRQATAVKGTGPGGIIPARSVGSEEPLKNIYGALLLVGLRVTVVGARGRDLVVEPPEWAIPPLGHPRILVPWGAATREEDV